MPRKRPIDPTRWEAHRKEISELYECNKLKDVRQLMLEKYGFVASQSQYERQVRKWNLKKNHTGGEWAALATICRKRAGKKTRVYYRETLIDPKRAQRAFWRHGYVSTIERVTQVDDPSTPSDFIVRTPIPEDYRQQSEEWCSKIPFAQFMTFLREAYAHDLLIPQSLSPQLLTTLDPVILDINHTSSLRSSGHTGILQKSQVDVITRKASAFIPTSMLQSYLDKSHPNSAFMMIVFSLTNGMAGLEDMDHRDIWSNLDVNSVSLLYQFTQSKSGQTSKELSQKLFDSAIIYGNVEVVTFTIAHKSLGININDHVCTFLKRQYTPLELSLSRGHYAVTRALIQNGANINAGPKSVLWHVFSYDRNPPIDLIDLLIEKGLHIDKHLILRTLMTQEKTQTSLSSARSHLMLRLLYGSTNSHAEFWRAGIFHYAISSATREVVGDIFQMVYNINKNVDAVYDDLELPSNLHTIRVDPSFPTTIMDSLTKHGQLKLVQQLHAAGCRIREHTLIYAIQSQEMQLVQFLLEKGARVDSSKWRHPAAQFENWPVDPEDVIRGGVITPYSEAIRSGNEELCAQLILKGALQNGDPRQVAAALHAFAEIGNFHMQDQLLRSIESLNIKQLIKNRLDCLDQLHTAVYHCLLEALCQGNNDIAQLSFDIWFELEPIFEVNKSRSAFALSPRSNGAALAFDLSLKRQNRQIAHLFLQLDAKFITFGNHSHETPLTYNGFTPLRGDHFSQALRWGDKSIFRDLLFLKGVDSWSSTSLFDIAIRKEDLALLKYLIESGFHVRSANLATAVLTGNLEIVSFLLERGASPDKTAFVDAVDQGTDMINLLLSSLAQKTQQVSSRTLNIPAEQAMRKLIQRNDVHLVRRLLQHGVGIDSSSIFVAATVSPEMLDLLLGVVDERYSEDRWSAGTRVLCEFITRNNTHLVRRLLAHHVELETFLSGRDIVSNVCYVNRDDSDDDDSVCLEILWEMRLAEEEEVLPLSVAIDKDQTHEQQILRAILESGASKQLNDVIYKSCSYPDAVQETALLRAVGRQDLAVLGLLVDSGADVNLFAAPRIRRTPLQKASELGAFEVVQFLLDRGADVNVGPAQYAGGTALQLAAMKGFAGIVDLLLTKGADINAKAARVHGRTALEGAAENGRLDTVTLLLQAGVRITEDGRRQFEKAMIFAEREQHYNVLKILESHDTMTQIPSPLNSQAEHGQEQDQDDSFMRQLLELSPAPLM